jgi:hypothetical protein
VHDLHVHLEGMLGEVREEMRSICGSREDERGRRSMTNREEMSG